MVTQVMKAELETQTGKINSVRVATPVCILTFTRIRQCGCCVAMPTNIESVCCCEVDRIVAKKEENESDIQCIVNHEGFDPVCLNLWVLQAAYFSFRQKYGEVDEKEPHQ